MTDDSIDVQNLWTMLHRMGGATTFDSARSSRRPSHQAAPHWLKMTHVRLNRQAPDVRRRAFFFIWIGIFEAPLVTNS